MTERAKKLLLLYCKQGGKIRRVSGLPLLTFKAKKAGTLKNYRIYGNTETKTRSYSGAAPLSFPIVDGAVSNYRIYGQTSRNLFDETIYNKNVADNTVIYVPMYVGNVDYVTCSTTCPKTGDDVHDGNNSRYIFFISGSVDAGAQNAANGVSNGVPRTIPATNGYVTIAYRKIESYNVRPWEYQTMLNVGSTALPYEPYGESVGDKTANILPLSRTPITETHGDFLCEYDGLGTITLTTDKDNAATGGGFVVPLIQNFTIPVSIGQGGTGCFQINNSITGGSANTITVHYNNTPIDTWNFNELNRFHSNYTSMGNKTIDSISVKINNGGTNRKITIKPAFVENVTEQVPFEPYGYKIPVTNNSETANIYLDEPLRKVGDEAEYVDYAEQKWHRVRKNLCPYESTNNTIIGHVKQGKTYTFSFYALYECGFNLQKRNADSGQTSMLTTRSNCNGNVEVTFQADENFDLYLNGYSQTTGKTSTDCISKLQLEESSAATSYEPYIENTEVDVTIPDLPAQSSTNSLSVGTVVQPSSVAVDVNEVVSCGDRIENLFDGSFIHRSVIIEEVGDDNPNRRSIVVDISNFNNGDKITFSRETSAGNLFQMYQVSSPLKGGKLLNSNVISGDSKTLLATITLDDISNYHYLMIFLNGATNIITDEELLASKIIVNVGNTPLPYDPYGYKVPVTVKGKNLFDGELEQGGYDGSGLNIDNTLRVRSTNYIPVVGGETYNLHALSKSSLKIHVSYYTKNDYTTRRLGCIDWTQNTVFTTPSNCKYIRFLFKTLQDSVITPDDISNIMLNAGSTPLPYEPYHAPVTTPIYLPEPIKMVGDEAGYIDYAEQKQHRVRKNLLKNTMASQIINGVTFTANEDGSITLNGTASKTIDLHLIPLDFPLPAGKYRLTGTPPSGSASSYYLRAWYFSSGSVVWINDPGNGIDFTLTDTKTLRSSIVILAGQILDNITFYPMIRKSDIEDDTYEPYIENIDLDVTLPALPVLPGTNILTVGTEVQPSDVEIKGRIKAAGGD